MSEKQQNEVKVPCEKTMKYLAKLSIVNDKPIMMDYWLDSFGGDDANVLIGVRETQEKLLVRSEEEYTSSISKIFKVPDTEAFIVITENSIYVVSSTIPTKRIS
tara:strand:+ start:487 stop:798 length:312 start_codon:yes stop_codon:yes gene_type:complete